MELKELSPLDEDLLIDLGYVKGVDYLIAQFDFDILTVTMIPKLDTEDYHDVYINEKNELYAKFVIVPNDYFYNDSEEKLVQILKIQYLKLYPKEYKDLPPQKELSLDSKVSVSFFSTKEPDLSLVKSYGYENIDYSGGFCCVSLPKRNNKVVKPVVKYNNALYIPSEVVTREFYPDSFKGNDIINFYCRVEYEKMIKKKMIICRVDSDQPMRTIYLNYKSKKTYMNIRTSHRTSNGFKYSCYDDSEIIGPYVNTSSLEFDENDKNTILSIIRSKRKYEITWEDDDCWSESFYGSSRDSIDNIGDMDICSVLNELFSEKYKLEFKPTPKDKEVKCSIDFEEILK